MFVRQNLPEFIVRNTRAVKLTSTATKSQDKQTRCLPGQAKPVSDNETLYHHLKEMADEGSALGQAGIDEQWVPLSPRSQLSIFDQCNRILCKT